MGNQLIKNVKTVSTTSFFSSRVVLKQNAHGPHRSPDFPWPSRVKGPIGFYFHSHYESNPHGLAILERGKVCNEMPCVIRCLHICTKDKRI
jgi:hypothetical protein